MTFEIYGQSKQSDCIMEAKTIDHNVLDFWPEARTYKVFSVIFLIIERCVSFNGSVSCVSVTAVM